MYMVKAKNNKRVNLMPKNITIFTTNTCAYCVMVKKWLGAKGMGYEEVNLDEHPERQQEAYELSGQLSVPVTVITQADDSREIVVGYNLAKLAPAVA
jgi:glutaredoxin 3